MAGRIEDIASVSKSQIGFLVLYTLFNTGKINNFGTVMNKITQHQIR